MAVGDDLPVVTDAFPLDEAFGPVAVLVPTVVLVPEVPVGAAELEAVGEAVAAHETTDGRSVTPEVLQRF